VPLFLFTENEFVLNGGRFHNHKGEISFPG